MANVLPRKRTFKGKYHGGPIEVLEASQTSKRRRGYQQADKLPHGPVITVMRNGIVEAPKRYARMSSGATTSRDPGTASPINDPTP